MAGMGRKLPLAYQLNGGPLLDIRFPEADDRKGRFTERQNLADNRPSAYGSFRLIADTESQRFSPDIIAESAIEKCGRRNGEQQ